jgi:hypothetical protein
MIEQTRKSLLSRLSNQLGDPQLQIQDGRRVWNSWDDNHDFLIRCRRGKFWVVLRNDVLLNCTADEVRALIQTDGWIEDLLAKRCLVVGVEYNRPTFIPCPG